MAFNDIEIDKYPYVLKHFRADTYGIVGCGGDGYFITHRPSPLSLIDNNDFLNIDGSSVTNCSMIRCGTCYEEIYFTTKDIRNRKEERDKYYFNLHRVKGLEDWDYYWDY